MEVKAQGAPIAATLSVVGFLLWVSLQALPGDRDADRNAATLEDPPARFDPPAGDSSACLAPVRWHVGEIDPRFGLSADDARRAVARATVLWERASGRRLFQESSAAGSVPIRFVYDTRQERVRGRLEAQGELRSTDEELERRGDDIERRDHELRVAVSAHTDRIRALDEDVEKHNREVRRLNAAGGAPEDIARELERAERALQDRRERLEREGRALEDTARAIQEDAARLSRDVEARNRTANELERAYAPERVESGLYRHAVTQTSDGVVTLSPEIRVFAFESEPELVSVLAHELGHALGLAHVEAPGALMVAEHARGGSSERPAVVDRADLQHLTEVCPP